MNVRWMIMNKKTHFLISAIALGIALPVPPVKGGIPFVVLAFASVHDQGTMIGTVFMFIFTFASLGFVIAISAFYTWLSWRLKFTIIRYVSLIILIAGLIYLMTQPVYDGGGFMDPVPSKTFVHMIRTGI